MDVCIMPPKRRRDSPKNPKKSSTEEPISFKSLLTEESPSAVRKKFKIPKISARRSYAEVVSSPETEGECSTQKQSDDATRTSYSEVVCPSPPEEPADRTQGEVTVTPTLTKTWDSGAPDTSSSSDNTKNPNLIIPMGSETTEQETVKSPSSLDSPRIPPTQIGPIPLPALNRPESPPTLNYPESITSLVSPGIPTQNDAVLPHALNNPVTLDSTPEEKNNISPEGIPISRTPLQNPELDHIDPQTETPIPQTPPHQSNLEMIPNEDMRTPHRNVTPKGHMITQDNEQAGPSNKIDTPAPHEDGTIRPNSNGGYNLFLFKADLSEIKDDIEEIQTSIFTYQLLHEIRLDIQKTVAAPARRSLLIKANNRESLDKAREAVAFLAPDIQAFCPQLDITDNSLLIYLPKKHTHHVQKNTLIKILKISTPARFSCPEDYRLCAPIKMFNGGRVGILWTVSDGFKDHLRSVNFWVGLMGLNLKFISPSMVAREAFVRDGLQNCSLEEE